MDFKATFNRYFNSERLSHAYIISGAGDEKENVAMACASAALCVGAEPPCGVCRHCRKVMDGTHPDVSIIEPEKDKSEIYVAQIRQLRADAVVLPNEAERKVYIIRRAETMNPPAQNALLKVLEEPPSYCSFVLLTENSGALLQTVRSRCVEVRVTDDRETDDGGEGEELLNVLMGGDRESKLRECFGMEKLSRPEFRKLMDGLRAAASKRLRSAAAAGKDDDAARLIKLLGILDEIDVYSVYNVGVGHTVGLILAQMI